MLIKSSIYTGYDLVDVEVEFDIDEGQRLIKFGNSAQEGIAPSVKLLKISRECDGEEVEITEAQGDRLRTDCWSAIKSGDFD